MLYYRCNNLSDYLREVVTIRKYFILANNWDIKKGSPAFDDLNQLLKCVGVSFRVVKMKNGYYQVLVDVDENTLRSATTSKAGRPVEHEIDYNTILKMQAAGETNKAIYTKLGMSKSLFYMKMREFKNNNGQCKGVRKCTQ